METLFKVCMLLLAYPWLALTLIAATYPYAGANPLERMIVVLVGSSYLMLVRAVLRPRAPRATPPQPGSTLERALRRVAWDYALTYLALWVLALWSAFASEVVPRGVFAVGGATQFIALAAAFSSYPLLAGLCYWGGRRLRQARAAGWEILALIAPLAFSALTFHLLGLAQAQVNAAPLS